MPFAVRLKKADFDMAQEFSHRSVLLDECIEGLAIKEDGIYVDGTAGGGGHSYHIAKKLTSGKLVAIDRDEAAIAAATARLSPFSERAIVYRNQSACCKATCNVKGLSATAGSSIYVNAVFANGEPLNTFIK